MMETIKGGSDMAKPFQQKFQPFQFFSNDLKFFSHKEKERIGILQRTTVYRHTVDYGFYNFQLHVNSKVTK